MTPARTADSDSPDLPALSNAEWEVMKVFWQRGPLAARDLYSALPEDRGWAYQTVKTLLSRLVQKGALSYQRVGNSYLYKAACSRKQMTRREVADFVDRVFDGAPSPVLAAFIERSDLSPEDLDRLREMLDDKARGAQGGEDGP